MKFLLYPPPSPPPQLVKQKNYVYALKQYLMRITNNNTVTEKKVFVFTYLIYLGEILLRLISRDTKNIQGNLLSHALSTSVFAH